MSKEPDMERKIYHNVPEGYFENLKTRLSAIPQEEAVSGWSRMRPYAALVAAFVAIVTVGSAILTLSSRSILSGEHSEEFGIAELIPSIDSYLYYSESDDTTEVSSEDDILEYLIQTHTSVEQIAYLGNEN